MEGKSPSALPGNAAGGRGEAAALGDWKASGYYRYEFGKIARFYDFGIRQAFKWIGGEVVFRCGIVEAAGIQPGHRVLDVACGTGTLVELMAHSGGPEGRVVGVDMSEHMLSVARRKAEASDLMPPQVDFFQANAEALPFDDSSFDRVTASLAIHEMNREGRLNALSEMYRVLKPGGLAAVADMRQPDTWFTKLGMRFVRLVETDTLTDMWFDNLFREMGLAGFAKRRRKLTGKGFFEIIVGWK
jgi:demethylmenaquinone methyltransferase/2-methoxy-6-polyprenyl-1,4-benzoquinol methylase